MSAIDVAVREAKVHLRHVGQALRASNITAARISATRAFEALTPHADSRGSHRMFIADVLWYRCIDYPGTVALATLAQLAGVS